MFILEIRSLRLNEKFWHFFSFCIKTPKLPTPLMLWFLSRQVNHIKESCEVVATFLTMYFAVFLSLIFTVLYKKSTITGIDEFKQNQTK